MKFNDLQPAKQKLLKAFTEGEIIQYYTPATGWKDTDMGTFFGAIEFCHPDWLRVKTKESKVTYLYSGFGIHGNIYNGEFESLEEIVYYYPKHAFHSYMKRTFHNGVFVKAEIIPKLELNLKGLI